MKTPYFPTVTLIIHSIIITTLIFAVLTLTRAHVKKILIIEDDSDTLDLVEIILQDAGYAVIKVNREVTIKEIAGIHPQLVILDALLPYMLGTDLCLQIKGGPTTNHIPTILYSASNNIKKLAKDCGADAYLSKPFDINELVELVNKMAL